jgi:hypothetical protein
VDGPTLIGFGTAAEEAVLEILSEADVLSNIKNVVRTVTAPKRPAA